MIITTDFIVKPFSAPDSVAVELPAGVSVTLPHPMMAPGYAPKHYVELRYLSPAKLSELCDQFRRDVFAAAGHRDPRT